MLKLERECNIPTDRRQTGFTLLETLVSLIILLAVSGIVMTGMMQLMQTQGTIANRTECGHSHDERNFQRRTARRGYGRQPRDHHGGLW